MEGFYMGFICTISMVVIDYSLLRFLFCKGKNLRCLRINITIMRRMKLQTQLHIKIWKKEKKKQHEVRYLKTKHDITIFFVFCFVQNTLCTNDILTLSSHQTRINPKTQSMKLYLHSMLLLLLVCFRFFLSKLIDHKRNKLSFPLECSIMDICHTSICGFRWKKLSP